MGKPNVVVFFTDQQRWDTTGVHGNPMGLTPNFDRLAASGTHLAQTFTCQPVCGPARAALQSGQYATRVGCHRNGIPLPRDIPTLATCFNEAGYQTGYVGKWHLSGEERTFVSEANRGGYRYWLGSGALEHTSDAYQTTLYDNDNRAVALPGYRVDALTDAAIRYIDGHKDEPFFLFLSHLEPHHQNHIDDYPPPEGYRERYAGGWMPPDLAALGGSAARHLGGYYGMVKRLDEAFGRLMDALKSLGLAEDTIVLFTSDHGCHFKTRNGEYKRSCHESSIRVPALFTGPGFDGGGRVSDLVSLVDLPPTLLDAAGIEPPSPMQGRSVMPLLTGQAQDWPEEVLVQISESEVGRAVRTRRWKYAVRAPEDAADADGAGSRVYREAFLYDLQSDPHELCNLIGYRSHQAVMDRMRERLLRRMEAAGEALPRIEAAEPVEDCGQRLVSEREVGQ